MPPLTSGRIEDVARPAGDLVERVLKMGIRSAMTGLALITLAACSAPAARSISPTSSVAVFPSVVASAEPSAVSSAIVGVWRGEHDCEGIAGALTDAGFDEAVIIENVVGNGLIPGVTSPADIPDVAELCADATVLEHSHEFTADGQFFSYDQDGEEVDFGTYELVDDDTLTIGAPDREGVTTFDFSIEDNHLTLEPQLPAACAEFECIWAVMVAMRWSGMERVE